MDRGLPWFLTGLLVGIVGTLLFQRVREEMEQDDADELAARIGKKLDAMEAVLQ